MGSISDSGMVSGLILSLLWIALLIVAFIAFLRGMRALTQIASRLEHIEDILKSQRIDSSSSISG
jgi:hypothetical protein